MSEPHSVSRVLGRYELLHPLGQGGMGEVHLARTQGAAGFEKLCIVKTILPQQVKDPQFVERFLHEARVLVQLTHSSIAQVYDMGDAGGQFFMSIEYVAGVDLARLEAHAWQHGATIPIPVALFVGQKIAEALGYAHRKTGADGAPLNIVHRDVSPQNVMVSYEGEVKVIDFGLAKSTARSNQTKAATVLGKFGYLSPEQARAERVDFRSDIYSCGIVLWELLAGRPLFESGSPGEMLARMANPKIPSLTELRPEVSQELARAVERALAVNPSDRYARADDLARALNERAIRDGLSISGEDVGAYVRERCATEFADHRNLISRLSSVTRVPSGTYEVEPTAIRRTPGPAEPLVEATAIRPAPTPQSANPSAPVVPIPLTTPASVGPVPLPIQAGSGPAASFPPAQVASSPASPLPPAAQIGSSPTVAPVPVPAANSRTGWWVALALGFLLVLGLGVVGGMRLAAKPTAGPSPAATPPAATAQPSTPSGAAAAAANPSAAPEVVVAAAQTAPPPVEAVAKADPVPPPVKRPGRRRRHAEAVVAPTQLEVPDEVTAPSSTVGPSGVGTTLPLAAAAKVAGIGPWRRVVVYNRGTTAWDHCELRLPDNRHAFLDSLEPGEDEAINMLKFKQDGPERDVKLDWLKVRCAQGSTRVKLK